jgi:SAM-dependent methyltransferase
VPFALIISVDEGSKIVYALWLAQDALGAKSKSLNHKSVREPMNYQESDEAYLALDKAFVRRTKNIQLIPQVKFRKGGKISYAEWAHVAGIFQTLIYMHLNMTQNPTILDIGCGTGLLAIASQPFLGSTGKYIGIDVAKEDIDFCRGHYPESSFEFVHLETENPFYAPKQSTQKLEWPIENSSVDLVTALSVWTHFGEEDAEFYLKEVGRVLKPGGKAIVTFFLLDDLYYANVGKRTAEEGQFHTLPQNRWVFDQPTYGSTRWFHPDWADVPEKAIGLNQAGLDAIADSAGLSLIERHNGNWKEIPGIFFQDVLIFQK